MFQEHLHILGMVDLATGIRLIHLLGCSIVKIASDAIDCDYRRTVQDVSGVAGIGKYTALYILTLDLSMSHVNAR